MPDQSKLDRLRARFPNDDSGRIHDPDYARVAASVFTGDRRIWPFAGVPTFLGANYRPQPQDGAHDFAGLDIALVGVPMDLGVTNRAGARLGPRAVRNIERIGPWEHVLRRAPLQEAKVADIGDVPFQSRFDLAACHADIESHIAAIAAAGVVPVSVGGDHSISYPILRALGRDRPVGMIHIDAHCDTGGVFEGSKFHHGGPFRQAVLDGVLDPDRTIQIGIRGGAGYLWEFSAASGMTVLEAEQALELGIPGVIAKARAVAGTGPVYVSFDIDSVDPGFAPGTGTPEVGGLAPREVLAILRGIAGLDVIGADVVEVAPQYDTTSNTAQIAAQVLFVEVCLAVEAIRARKSRTDDTAS